MFCMSTSHSYEPLIFLPPPQVLDRAEHIGSALLHRGHSHTGDKFIGIFSQNRPEVQYLLLHNSVEQR